MLARLAAVLFLALIAPPPAAQAAPALSAQAPPKTTIPFQLVDNRMIVQATIDGVPGFAMIVDTGAPDITITPQVAQRLALKQHTAGTIYGAGSGRLAITRTTLNDVALGGYHLVHQPTTVADLSAIRRGIGFPQFDGIVGFNLIASHFVSIDTNGRTLTISQTPLPVPPGAQRVPLTSPDGFYHVKAVIDGAAGDVILDTGDRFSFTIFKTFAEHNGFYNVTPVARNALTGFGIGGPIHSNVIRTHLDVFGFSIPNVVTRVPLGNAGIFTASPLAGSIGNGVLRRFNIVFDGIHHTMTVWPSNRFAEVERYDPLGLWIAEGQSAPVVGDVTPGGPADRAGVHTGDSLLALNGRSAESWSIPDIRAWIAQQPDGSSISLLLQSPSGTRTTRTAIISDPFSSTDPPELPRRALFGAALTDTPKGVTVVRVLPNTAAANAGIQTGDVVTQFNDIATPSTAALLTEMQGLRAGRQVTVVLKRGSATQQHIVSLGSPSIENDPSLTTTYGTIAVDGTLRRTLITMPIAQHARLPALLLIGGTGCYSVDVPNDPQDPYLHLTHDVSSAGFVTMRLEKSGVGDSQGPPCRSVDLAAEERGYAAALSALRANSHVDASHVFLFGHSIGSLEAPRLAAKAAVAGIIVAEGVGRDWPEYEIRNLRRQLELTGTSPADVDAALIEKQTCFERFLVEKQPESVIEHTMPDCKVHNGVYPVEPAYMQQIATINVIDQWMRVNVPVLAIYGRSDFITEESDHQRIVSVVNVNHPNTAIFQPIDGMDHYLARADSPKASLQAIAHGTPRQYDTDLSRVVVRWLCSRAHCANQ